MSHAELYRNGAACGYTIRVADTFLSRSVGLLGSASLPPQSGLWITPCVQVHTAMMRYPIDVIMLDETGSILAIAPSLGPWRVGPQGASRGVALELPAGAAQSLDLRRDDRLTLRGSKAIGA